MVPFADYDLVRAFPQTTMARARTYLRDRRVLRIEEDSDGVISGVVRGSGGHRYTQDILVVDEPNGYPSFSSECSCPVGVNCKHVAAVLLAYIQEAKKLRPRALPLMRASAPIAKPSPNALPPQVSDWLRRLEEAGNVETEDYPPGIRRRLIYCLNHRFNGASVDLESIEVKQDGMVSRQITSYRIEQLTTAANLPKFLRPSDHAILRRLRGFGGPAPATPEFTDTLRQIIATGRGRWGGVDGPALTLAEPRRAALAWRIRDDGSQTPALDLPEPLVVLRLAEPWYADPATGAVGPIETGLPAAVIRALLDAPAVPHEVSAAVAETLAQRFPTTPIPPPAALPPPRALTAPLRPQLTLFVATLPFDPASPGRGWRYTSAMQPTTVALARLQHRYGPVTLMPKAGPLVMHEGALLSVVRNAKAERAASARLSDCGLNRLGDLSWQAVGHKEADSLAMTSQETEAAWVRFMLHDIHTLRREGWDVVVHPDFPYRIHEADGPITVQLRPSGTASGAAGAGIDWLELELGVMLDDRRVDLLPALLTLLGSAAGGAMLNAIATDPQAYAAGGQQASQPLLIPMDDGSLIAVPMQRVMPILAPLMELFAARPGDGAPRLSRHDAAEIAALEEVSAAAGMVWEGGDAIRTLGRQLRDAGGIPAIPPPATFLATLRPYQASGVHWMAFLREAGLGGVLADDMGLGKTVQALAHLVIEQAAGRLDRPCLVICPTSVAPNWRAEAARFAPTLRVLMLHGPERKASFDVIPAHDLVITTYPLLARDHATLTAQDWHVVLLDEAQTIKNPAATTSKLARTLQARQRLCLSGTPLENHLGELWSLFDFVLPGFLGTQKSFGRQYRTPIEKSGDTERQAVLARRVAPFMLRRTKDVVAADLPPKSDIAEIVEMAAPQRALYDSIRLAMHTKVQAAIASRGLAQSGIIILDALLKLRQTCCDPRLLKLKTTQATRAGSAKLDRLMDMLPMMLEEGRRVLLFSQFTSMLALIQQQLEHDGIAYELLTGDTKDRTTPVRRFQSGTANLFLISLKAGGVGLNLTAADTVIHYDPWWNPAVEDQATDRAHRIGQDKPVFVHRLITAGSIEEKIELLKARKQALVDGILGGGAGATLGITEADLEDLFAPVG